MRRGQRQRRGRRIIAKLSGSSCYRKVFRCMLHFGQNPVHPFDWQSAPNCSLARLFPHKIVPVYRVFAAIFVRPSKIETALLAIRIAITIQRLFFSRFANQPHIARRPSPAACTLGAWLDFCVFTGKSTPETTSRLLCKTIIHPRG